MKVHLTLILLSFFVFSVDAQTTLSGGSLSGVLRAVNSPYLVTGDLTVPEDSLLTIEAGVYLDFADSIKLIVRGNINCNGTAASPITLTCTDSLNGWGGVILLNKSTSDTNRFDYCKFLYTGYWSFDWLYSKPFDVFPIEACGILAYESSPLKVIGCTFYRNRFGIRTYKTDLAIDLSSFNGNIKYGRYENFGPFLRSSCISSLENKVDIRNSTFIDNYNGVSLSKTINENVPNISDSYFKNNEFLSLELAEGSSAKNCTFYSNGCDVMRIYDWSGKLDSCVFEKSYGDCASTKNIRFFRNCSQGLIENCTFKNTVFDGVNNADLRANNGASLPVVKDCLFDKSGGIAISGGSEFFITGCIFNQSNGSIAASQNGLVANCLFVNNALNYMFDTSFIPSKSYSSAIFSSANTIKVYNSIFYGNKSFNGTNVNATLANTGKVEFYNCILNGEKSSINKKEDTGFTFTGTYQDCFDTYPNFADTANRDFRFTQSCSQLPVGFNKGYTLPVSRYYRGTTYPDILRAFDDLEDMPGQRKNLGTRQII